MSSYPAELRWRVVSAYESGEGSYRELAQRFMVDPSTVGEWMRLYQNTGGIASRSCGRKSSSEGERLWKERLTELLEEQNDLTLAELVELLDKRYNKQTSTSSVDRWLSRLNITRKKRHSGPVNKTVNASKL